MSDPGTGIRPEDLTREILRQLLRIHISDAGPYEDIMRALCHPSGPETHQALKRCAVLWEMRLSMRARADEALERITNDTTRPRRGADR